MLQKEIIFLFKKNQTNHRQHIHLLCLGVDDSDDETKQIDLNCEPLLAKSHIIAESENKEIIMQHWIVGKKIKSERKRNFQFFFV